MDEGSIECLQPGINLGAHVRHLTKRAVGGVQGGVVAGGLEYRQRLLEERGQPPRRRRAQLQGTIVERAELGPVAVRLLEVVAEDLVELHEVPSVLLEPGREALV